MEGILLVGGAAAARPLLADLSAGPFTQEWGALPVALWLLAEQSADPTALHRFATAGPTAVRALAQRHLPPELSATVAALWHGPPPCPAGGARERLP